MREQIQRELPGSRFHMLFPIYAVVLILLLELKAKGSISFVGMNFWLVMLESVLGGYIGQMVNAFFREE